VPKLNRSSAAKAATGFRKAHKKPLFLGRAACLTPWLSQWLSPVKRFFLGGMLAVLLLLVSWQACQTLWETSIVPVVHQALAKLGFRVEYVFVTGRCKTSRADVLKTAQLALGNSLFLESPTAMKDRLEALPWVRKACVERRFPHTIWIRLREKKPLALWQYGGALKLIDQSGAVIPCAAQEVPLHLITVVGEKACWNAPAFLEILACFPELSGRVTAAVYLRVGRWDLHLKNGWVVKLPEKRIEKALQQLLAFEQKQTLPVSKISALDLRFQGAFVLKLGSAPAVEKTKKRSIRVKNGKEV
jgi:cell division protein FtsQ